MTKYQIELDNALRDVHVQGACVCSRQFGRVFDPRCSQLRRNIYCIAETGDAKSTKERMDAATSGAPRP